MSELIGVALGGLIGLAAAWLPARATTRRDAQQRLVDTTTQLLVSVERQHRAAWAEVRLRERGAVANDPAAIFEDLFTDIDTAAYALRLLGDADVRAAVDDLSALASVMMLNVVTGEDAPANVRQSVLEFRTVRSRLMRAVQAQAHIRPRRGWAPRGHVPAPEAEAA